MRLHRPIGTILIMLPCWWGLALTHTQQVFPYIVFMLGALIMRSFGCIVNDWVDRHIDPYVKRTKIRPLASKSISMPWVMGALLLCLIVAGGIWLYLNVLAKIIALVGLVLCLIYPWMKRFTNWPQLVLGLAFNIGILVAYAQMQGVLSHQAWILYMTGIAWTLSYDTVYAFQDLEDDIKLNVGSTARVAQNAPKAFVGFWLFILLITLGISRHWLFPIPLGCLMFYHLWCWQPQNSPSCMLFFKQHAWYGWMIWLILLLTH